jgi:hypothetical protein
MRKELQVITCCQATTENMRGSNQISDISRFWVNDVTLKKVLKIANRKFHDSFNSVGNPRKNYCFTEKSTRHRYVHDVQLLAAGAPGVLAGIFI